MKPVHLLTALLVVTIWGSNFTAMRIGALELPPWLLLALRLGLAGGVLALFVPLPTDQFGRLFGIATSMGIVHFGLSLVAMQHIGAATAAIAMQVAVPFAALLAWILFGERLGWQRAAGMAVAFAGIVVIGGAPSIAGHVDMLLVLMLSASAFAVANIQIKRLAPINFMSLNAWIALIGAPLALLLSLVFERGQIEALRAAPWPALSVIVYMALVVSIVGHGLWYWLVPRYETNQTMPLTLLVPVLGVLFGVLLLDEPLSATLVAGGGLTVTGVAVIVLRRPETAAAPATRAEP